MEAGPVALWNKKQTEDSKKTVRKGDFVVKVKAVGQSESISGDSKLMLQALVPEGSFEVEIKPAAPQEVAPTQEVVPTQAQEAAAAVEDEAPAGTPVVAPVDVPAATEAAVVAPAASPSDAPVVELVGVASTEPPGTQPVEPSKAADVPATQSVEEPSKAVEVPASQPVDEPSKTPEEPKAADEPEKAADEPEKAAHEPVKAADEPVNAAKLAKPVTTAEDDVAVEAAVGEVDVEEGQRSRCNILCMS